MVAAASKEGSLRPAVAVGLLAATVLMLALVFSQFFILMFNFFPVTSDFSSWYAAATIFPLAVAAVLLAYAFHTSLAGQRLFKDSLIEE